MVRRTCLLAALVVLGGCIDTATEPISMPLSVSGTSVADDLPARGDVTVTLERADLVFGPLTFCAGFLAGDNCSTALVEWTDSVVVDTLDPTPVSVGELIGVSGTARSYMYDLGYVSLLVTTEPLELAAAAELDGSSLVLEGVAHIADDRIAWRYSTRFVQPADVERGAPIVRSRRDSGFERTLSDGDPITVRVDPSSWFASASFASLRQDEGCSEPGTTVCGGQVERRCSDGDPIERDCESEGLVCQPDVGCTDRILIEDGSQIGSAIRTAILAGVRPSFEGD